MNAYKGERLVKICNVKDFDITHIFECGQCFRWDRYSSNSYIGIAHDRVIEVSFVDGTLTIQNTSQDEFDSIWKKYFDLDCDYSKIKKELSFDKILNKAISFGSGIRILNQDLWECIISFIISANNNIPRIKGIIDRFCEAFGNEMEYKGKKYYTFPSPSDLSGISVSDLSCLRAGFRDKYICDAIEKVNSGEVSLEKIKNASTQEAREELLKIKGIGRKVADCVLLFGAGKREVFPVDVWVKKVLSELYFDEMGENDAFTFANKKFGEYAGIAQQYLFYYMRENSKEAKNNGFKENI